MAIQDITKPMALDETLQGTNTKMDGVIEKLQGIIDALGLNTSVYKPKGNIVCAALIPALLIEDNLGNVYNVTDNGTTTSDFVEGAGKPIHVGDNVAIVDVGTGGQSEYKFDLLAGMVDLTNYVEKSTTPGLLKNDGTVDESDYAEKVSSATNGNLAGLNGEGNLTDSGWASDKTTTSATGNPISISGLKSNQLAINPIITLEPIQAGSGTPSPSNIRAISGYDKVEVLSCGKNLFNKDKTVLNKGMTPTGETSGTGQCYSDYIVVKPNTTYYLTNVYGSASYFSSVHFDKNFNIIGAKNVSGSGIQSGAITTYENSAYMVINTGMSIVDTVQIVEGNTATAFEPYHKTTSISESLGQTVYGATWYPRTGVFTVTHGVVDLGTLTWQYINSFFYATSPSDSIPNKSGGYDVVCAAYVCHKGSISVMPDLTVTFNNTSWGGSKTIAIKDTTAGSDPAAFKTAMSGVLLVYPLETPFTIQLTPHEISLLKDYAYLSTNGTNIALDYHNGELASLSDVAQLGETVNELGDCLKGEPGKVYSSRRYWFTASASAMSIEVSSFTLPDNIILIGAILTQETSSGTDGYALLNRAGRNIACINLTSGKGYGLRLLYIVNELW